MGINSIFNRLKQLSKLQRLLFIGVGSIILVLIVQMFLPTGRILPRASLDGQRIGWQSRAEVAQKIEHSAATLQLDLNGKLLDIPAQDAGIYVDAKATINRLPVWSWGDKLIPLWPFIKAGMPTAVQTSINKDPAKIDTFASKIAKQLYREPVNAKAEIKNSQLIISRQGEGWEYSAESIKTALLADTLKPTTPIAVSGQAVPAKITEQNLAPLNTQFQKATSQQLTIAYGDKQINIDRDTFVSWLTIKQAGEEWHLNVGGDLIGQSFSQWSSEYNKSAGTTVITMVDDVETGRSSGEIGRALDKTGVVQQLNEWLTSPNSEPIILASSQLYPKIDIKRTYTKSSAGLQAIINSWVNSHGGSYKISVIELGGRGLQASYDGGSQTVMASTYKTFLAFVAYRLSESGSLDLNAVLPNGRNINQCIHDMIVVSDNPCAEDLGGHIGWATVDSIIASAGFSGVRLNNYDGGGGYSGDKLASADQQASLVARLSSGGLINSGNTGTLLDYMKQQIYRSGIPAGSSGATVADKVGFFGPYLHDAGVVYGPHSTYALAILTSGSSWANVSDLARVIYDFMNN